MNKRTLITLLIPLALLVGAAFAGDFVDLGDATVLDRETNLIWQQGDAGASLTWQEALDYCNALVHAGHYDWVLPNVKELESLIDPALTGPALDSAAFPLAATGKFWSSTGYAFSKANAWRGDFTHGDVNQSSKSLEANARCVR